MDLRVFCNGYAGYSGYPWVACWRPLIPTWPVMEDVNEPLGSYDPNEPYDPNEYCDPNDPNCGEYSMMSSNLNTMQSLSIEPRGECGLTAAQLEEGIRLLMDMVQEGDFSGEGTDNVLEIIAFMQDELDALNRASGWYTQ
jgi:hypothetical protein